jgi:hypothetical protein
MNMMGRRLATAVPIRLGAETLRGISMISENYRHQGPETGLSTVRIPATSGRIPATPGRIPATPGRIPATPRRIPATSGRIPATRARLGPVDPVRLCSSSRRKYRFD